MRIDWMITASKADAYTTRQNNIGVYTALTPPVFIVILAAYRDVFFGAL